MANSRNTVALRIRRQVGSNWLTTDFYQDEVHKVIIPDPQPESVNVLANNKRIFYTAGDKYSAISVDFLNRPGSATLEKLKTLRNWLQADTTRSLVICPRYQADPTDVYTVYMGAGQVPDRISAHGFDQWGDKITVTFDVADIDAAVVMDDDIVA